MCFWAKSGLMRCGGRHPNSLFSFFSLVVSHFPLFFSHHMGDGGTQFFQRTFLASSTCMKTRPALLLPVAY